MRNEAKEYLPDRVAYLAFKNKLKYRNLYLKNMKSQWGSCSYENNINLSLHLMRLPVELIDYVILHELAHTVEKNHSPRFWNLVEKFMPKAKLLDSNLKNYHPELF
jgi:predicted metal-dependent hydrolase